MDFISSRYNADDTWDFRVGGEWEFRQTWSLRAGYAHTVQAVPSQRIMPARPEGSAHGFDIGIGKKGKNWNVDLLYEYLFTKEIDTTDNLFGFNGDYSIKNHSIAVTALIKF